MNQNTQPFPTLFEKSQPKQRAYSLPAESQEFEEFTLDPSWLRLKPPALPECSELDLMRHFSTLASRNRGIDTHFYPLGSCTMKLNPRVNEWAAQLPGFSRTHPLAPTNTVQGNLQIIHELIQLLCQVSGMDGGSLIPNAGAQGEFTGLQMINAFHKHNKDYNRNEILVPDNAHGTNPASAAMAGFKVIPIPSLSDGDLNLEELKKALSPRTAGLMLTNPSTLGLFSNTIVETAKLVHDAGGLLYYDGANLNSILNIVRPGEMGFDVMHINLHKTFSTPHGGGGPGSGPVLCSEKLLPFLPLPYVILKESSFEMVWDDPLSIGYMASFHGNFAIYLRAYLYFKLHGHYGLRRIAEMAVLNANYLKHCIEPLLTIPFKQPCMHEFVIQADKFLDQGIRALDIAKRLLDYGVYAPTIYFPLIVKECMLIEPTETESKQTLDRFIEIIQSIIKEIETDPDLVKSSPHLLQVGRLDEVQAAKKPILRHTLSKE